MREFSTNSIFSEELISVNDVIEELKLFWWCGVLKGIFYSDIESIVEILRVDSYFITSESKFDCLWYSYYSYFIFSTNWVNSSGPILLSISISRDFVINYERYLFLISGKIILFAIIIWMSSFSELHFQGVEPVSNLYAIMPIA